MICHVLLRINARLEHDSPWLTKERYGAFGHDKSQTAEDRYG